MKKTSAGTLFYSPSDLIRFMQSPFSAWMDRFHLECPGKITPDEDDAQKQLITGEGNKHEQAYLDRLRSQGTFIVEINKNGDFASAAVETVTAVRSKAPVVYQAALQLDNFAGYSDFLILGQGGDYEIWDTKLGRSPKPYYLIQLCCYAELLAAITGNPCSAVGTILVSSQHRLRVTGEPLDLRRFPTSDYWFYYLRLKSAFLKLMADFTPDLALRPTPSVRADHGRWQSHADAWFEETDHLSRVAKITVGQIKKLEAAGIRTVAALANSENQVVPRMVDETRIRLLHQARIQLATRERRISDREAQPAFEVLSCVPGEKRGLDALPPADSADIYLDMEGYPLAIGGLEYLFGACYHEGGNLIFRDWWAHDRLAEKRAFEGFIDWAFARWQQNPRMHIYHYAAYEVSAIRRLSTGHATREEEVDHLLRNEVFVDLYQIVRHGILLGEDSYSIKKVELLYRGKRRGDVATAGDSIVEYANWIASGEAGDPARSSILKAIRDYNEDDCRSTAELVDWLRSLQQEYRITPFVQSFSSERNGETQAGVEAVNPIKASLLGAAYDGNGNIIRPDLETLGFLLDFHQREDKPMWWRKFDRIAASVEELADDISCLSQVQAVGSPGQEKRSLVQTYSFSPDEDTKLAVGSKVMFTHEPNPKFEVVNFDHKSGRIDLKIGTNKLDESFDGRFPSAGALIPDEFVSPDPIPAAIERAAKAYQSGNHPLLSNLLERKPPISNSDVLVFAGENPAAAAIRIAGLMDNSVLCIQGPPGTGKTYTGSHVIASLLRVGKRVGVMSNSHKAILILVRATGKILADGEGLIGIKIGGDPEDAIFADFPHLCWVKAKDALAAYQQSVGLVAGTAWPFSREEWDGALDYLIVDEAGQVSLADLVGVSLAARNLILLGDQMQLEQPIQGAHPGEAGTSALLYYLQEHATIPPELGIFLDRSFRMHPDVCRFISETVYEARLTSVSETALQRISLKSSARLVNKEAGIQFIPVEHDGNVQSSDEEIEHVLAIFSELLGCRFRDSKGQERFLSLEDFLFISPYNLQVNRLRARLPEGARVGSVDKFQGQEAPVTIFSMGSSFGEYGSRGLTFLLDRNRINVAISRAQCLAVVVGDPRIAHTEANSLHDMSLVNLYCRLVSHSTSSP